MPILRNTSNKDFGHKLVFSGDKMDPGLSLGEIKPQAIVRTKMLTVLKIPVRLMIDNTDNGMNDKKKVMVTMANLKMLFSTSGKSKANESPKRMMRESDAPRRSSVKVTVANNSTFSPPYLRAISP